MILDSNHSRPEFKTKRTDDGGLRTENRRRGSRISEAGSSLRSV